MNRLVLRFKDHISVHIFPGSVIKVVAHGELVSNKGSRHDPNVYMFSNISFRFDKAGFFLNLQKCRPGASEGVKDGIDVFCVMTSGNDAGS